jgi:hypothetical protein
VDRRLAGDALGDLGEGIRRECDAERRSGRALARARSNGSVAADSAESTIAPKARLRQARM